MENFVYKLCVIGNPVEHSLSPQIHQQFAKQFGLNIRYTKMQPEIDAFAQTVIAFRQAGGYGCNITIPFKQEAYQLATQTSKRAFIAKAVNTFLLHADGTIYGDNTDGLGLVNDIKNNLHYSLTGRTILILGAGGAVRGILHPILLESPARVIIANRTVEKAQQLAKTFVEYGEITGCGFDDLKNTRVDVVIDGTGFHSAPQLPERLDLSENSLCYDLKYGKTSNLFMRWAHKKNCQHIAEGLGMLVEQAAEAFFIWTGKRPNTFPVLSIISAEVLQ